MLCSDMIKISKIALLGVSLLFACCSLLGNRTAPAGLIYTPDTHSVVVGRSSTTYAPTLAGGISEDVTFAIAIESIQGIEIAPSSGEISIDESAAIGEFLLDLIVTNSVGATTFVGAITLSILSEAIPPVAIVYADSTISLTTGISYSSDPPLVDDGGESITSFLLVPDITGVSVDPFTGVIGIASSIGAGEYSVGVSSENLAGISVFNSVVTITITIPPAVTYVSNIRPVISGSCTPCHTGGSQINLTVYANAKGRIGEIIRRISLPQGESDFMPREGSKLSTTKIELFEEWQSLGSPES